MCGIVGYIGNQQAAPLLLQGLAQLEYRGYDSCGVSVLDQTRNMRTIKAVGKVKELERLFSEYTPEGTAGIGHTRWATHGGVTQTNAHPHTDCAGNIALVHNGIIENHRELKEKLAAEGHRFASDTDTEVLAHLVENAFSGNLEEAVIAALLHIKGTYGLAVISRNDPHKIVAAKNSSPLLIGTGSGEYFIASDASAVLSHTKKVVYLEDGEIAVVTRQGVTLTDLKRAVLSREPEHIAWDAETAQKGGYPHFMLKEIFEQPDCLARSLAGRLIEDKGLVKLGGLEAIADELRTAKHIIITACGTAYLAGLVGEYMLEEHAGIPVEVEYASEFRYRMPHIEKHTAMICISQSGETADTLAALQEAKKKGAITIGIINTIGSSIARQTHAGIYNHIGPEIGVASTKAFVSQLAILALLTIFFGRQRGLSQENGLRIAHELGRIPLLAEKTLSLAPAIEHYAKKYASAEHFLYLGRKYVFPIALEGALKLKEISYIHAEGYAAGEMKHGPIALIDEHFPTFAIATHSSVYEKMYSNLEEIKARKGPILAVATERDAEIGKLTNDVIFIPRTIEMLAPLLAVIPLQLFAYYVSVLRGRDPDKPRNLAKSVTVE